CIPQCLLTQRVPPRLTELRGPECSCLFLRIPVRPLGRLIWIGTDTESEPFEDPIDTETPESPLAITPPIPLSESIPPVLVPILRRTTRMAVRVPHAMSSGLSAGMAEVAAIFESAFRKRFWSYYESSPSVSPPDLPSQKRYCGTSELVKDSEEEDDEEDEEIKESMDSGSVSEDAEDEGPTTEDDDPAAEDEGAGVEGPCMDDEGYGLDDGSHGIDDEGHSVEGDGLGLEEDEEAIPGELEEGDVYSTFEVRQGYGSALEFERPERVSTFRQPTLTTWTDPEDGMIYIDIPDYPPPAPPVQTPPSPEWTSGSLPISPSPSDDPSPISSPMIPLTVPSPVATPAAVETEGFLTELGAQVQMQGGLISDHAVRLEELSPALFERYDRDIGELFTRSGAVREEIFSQRYRFRSLEYEQERVAVTFRAIWRPVLALEAWAGQTDAQRAALWHAISDVQGENRDLRLQLAKERRTRLELAKVFDGIRRWQEPRGGVSNQRYLDATTLRELIDHNGRLIADDPAPGVMRFAMPRPLRPTLQDLSDRMGRIEIQQGVPEQISRRQSYHSDRYANVFEYIAGHYGVPLAGEYAPSGNDEEQQQE
ncbi:hypothetical protein Tco_0631843, partial [Tanacetum coccineum]